MHKWLPVLSYGATLTIGVLIGLYVCTGTLTSPHGSKEKIDYSEEGGKYTYINPLLFCSDQEISNYNNSLTLSLESKLRDYIKKAQSDKTIADASVYYRDLNDGPWVLINGTMRTVPASLLKVPTALAIYKHAEKDPTFLDKKITLAQKDNPNSEQHFPPKHAVVPGQLYTMKELVELMLKDSDNGALFLLGTSLPESEFVTAYSDIGIPVPTEVAPGYTVSARTYASFFRILFNSSYLTHDSSEYLLSVLADSSFTQGMRAGLPPGVAVADKFGEYRVSEDDLRLNDCGIVYRPHDPYILCVFTKGTNFDTLAGVISTISKMVFEELEATDAKN